MSFFPFLEVMRFAVESSSSSSSSFHPGRDSRFLRVFGWEMDWEVRASSCCYVRSDFGSGNSKEKGAPQVFDEVPASDWKDPSRVLEITVHRAYYPITEKLLHQVFDPFGAVEFVPVLGGSDFAVFLVVFRSIFEAVEAYGTLHGRNIYDGCCQMDIKYGRDKHLEVTRPRRHQAEAAVAVVNQRHAARMARIESKAEMESAVELGMLKCAVPQSKSANAAAASASSATNHGDAPATASVVVRLVSAGPCAAVTGSRRFRVGHRQIRTGAGRALRPHLAAGRRRAMCGDGRFRARRSQPVRVARRSRPAGAHRRAEGGEVEPATMSACAATPSSASHAATTLRDTIVVNLGSELDAEEATPTSSPTRCSTDCPSGGADVLVSKPSAPASLNVKPVSMDAKVVFDEMHQRYIFSLPCSCSVGDVLLGTAIEVPLPAHVFDEEHWPPSLLDCNTLLPETIQLSFRFGSPVNFSWVAMQHKPPWPPPVQCVMQRLGMEVEMGGCKAPITTFIVEPFVPYDQEYYLSIASARLSSPISFSECGGVEIEENWNRVKTVFLLTAKPMPQDACAPLVATLPLEAREKFGDFIKLNAEPYHLDMRGELDATAVFKKLRKWEASEFPLPFGRVLSPTESFIPELDEKTSTSLKFIWLLPAKGLKWPPWPPPVQVQLTGDDAEIRPTFACSLYVTHGKMQQIEDFWTKAHEEKQEIIETPIDGLCAVLNVFCGLDNQRCPRIPMDDNLLLLCLDCELIQEAVQQECDGCCIEKLQVPWDPGGLTFLHRLEGKSNFKEGRMSLLIPSTNRTSMARGQGDNCPAFENAKVCPYIGYMTDLVAAIANCSHEKIAVKNLLVDNKENQEEVAELEMQDPAMSPEIANSWWYDSLLTGVAGSQIIKDIRLQWDPGGLKLYGCSPYRLGGKPKLKGREMLGPHGWAGGRMG